MVRYVIQRYQRYAIYEPAEGGYYYEGKEPDDGHGDLIIRDTKAEAVEALKKLVEVENEDMAKGDEGYLIFRENDHGAWADSINHRYIGDGCEYYVEPINRRGRKRSGRVPYC